MPAPVCRLFGAPRRSCERTDLRQLDTCACWQGAIRRGQQLCLFLLCLTIGLVPAEPTLAQAPAEGSGSEIDSETALSRLQEYLKIDTTNPPGNEMAAVRFFAKIFEREGIPFEVAESAPGRGNIWARLEGGPGRALVLLHHLDVVPADPEFWDRHPFSGEVADGFVHGRGALDTKGLGILHLEAFLSLARSRRELRRPVVFLATADEEAGGALGAGWMVRERPEVFRDAGFLLNEGGGGLRFGEVPVFSVEVTQKVPLWLRLRAEGVPGHGSNPRPHSAVATLLRALARLEQHRFPARLTEPVRRYFEGLADLQPGLGSLQDLDLRVRDPRFMRSLHVQNPSFHALLSNTCAITVLRAVQRSTSWRQWQRRNWTAVFCRMRTCRSSRPNCGG